MEHTTLPNGLSVIVETMPCTQSCAFGFFVRCGSRNETTEIAGVSHFLEHMLFKGTETRSAADVNREFDAMGVSFNAYTTEEATVFYASLLPEFLEKSLAIYADLLRPALRESDFESEKQVILEEIEMYEDTPPFCVDERIREAFFNGHPIGNCVLGSTTSVSQMNASAMRCYFHQRYSPRNITLAACGNVAFADVKALVLKYCANWENAPADEAAADGQTSEETTNSGKFPQQRATYTHGFRHIRNPQATQTYTLQCAAAPSASAPLTQRTAARLAASMLGDDSGSRLYWALVDEGLAEHATLSFTEFTDVGMFSTSFACEPENAERNLEAVQRIYADAMQEGFSPQELELAQNRLVTALVLGNERPLDRLFSIGADWLFQRAYRTVREEPALLKNTTLADVRNLLDAFPLLPALTYVVSNKPERKHRG